MMLAGEKDLKGVKTMVRKLATIFFAVSALSLLSLCGCGGGKAEPQTGNIVVVFNFPPEESRLIPSATTEIIVSVMGGGLTAPLKGTVTRSQPRVVFTQLTPGNKFLLAFSRTSSTAQLPATMGFATATVRAGQTTRVEIELQPIKPPTPVTSEPSGLQDNDKNQTLFLKSTNEGLQWSGFSIPQRTVTFDAPLVLLNGARIGQTVSTQVTVENQLATATMRLAGVMGVGVPAGDFANCVVLELSLTRKVGIELQLAFYRLFLARDFGPVWINSRMVLDEQVSTGEVHSVLVSGQIMGVTPSPFSFASPVNKLDAPNYDGNLNAYLPQVQENRYDFSEVQIQENPPGNPF